MHVVRCLTKLVQSCVKNKESLTIGRRRRRDHNANKKDDRANDTFSAENEETSSSETQGQSVRVGGEDGATKVDCPWISEDGVTCEKENERGNCSMIKPVFAFRQFL